MNKDTLVVAVRVLASVALSLLAVWGALALWFQLPALRLPAAVLWGVGAV